MYFFAPISLYALEAWPAMRQLSSILGLVISVSALVASSFSTQVWHLILTQGVLYAIGGSLLYSPTMFYLDEWFIKKKGLAFGIIFAGVGAFVFLCFLIYICHILTFLDPVSYFHSFLPTFSNAIPFELLSASGHLSSSSSARP